MNKELIKQIEELPGVETVESMSDKVVVTFEAEITSVKVTNQEQFNFAWNKYERDSPSELTEDMCIYLSDMRRWDKEFHANIRSTIISFTQYLTDYNLKAEYLKFMVKEAEKRGLANGVKYNFNDGSDSIVVEPMQLSEEGTCLLSANGCNITLSSGEWATIIPNEVELVKGEIYYSKEDGLKWLFRFKGLQKRHQAFYYSMIDHKTIFRVDSWLAHKDSTRTCKPATNKQKRKLIKAEVANKYFHELNKAK